MLVKRANDIGSIAWFDSNRWPLECDEIGTDKLRKFLVSQRKRIGRQLDRKDIAALFPIVWSYRLGKIDIESLVAGRLHW